MNVDQSIKELLYLHRCVIVPDFGGFVLNQESAKFNPIEYTFTPPKSTVYFNHSLKSDDGLLTHYLSKQNSLDYLDVSNRLQHIAAEWKADLAKGKTIKLDSLGDLKIENGHISFEADKHTNFDLSSFGMNAIKAQYIHREQALQPMSTKKTNSWISYAAAIAFAVGVGSLGIFANQQMVGSQWSSILPIANTSIEMDATVHNVAENDEKTITPLVITGLPELKPTPASSTPIEKEVAVPERLIKQHQVIGGSFKSLNDAKTHLAKLQRIGYDESVLVGKVGNFYIIAYNTFDNYEEALFYKRELEQEGRDVFLRES